MTTTGLRSITLEEHFEFHDLAALKVWIDQFKPSQLAAILFTNEHGNPYITFHFETEELSDGSKVNNIRIS